MPAPPRIWAYVVICTYSHLPFCSVGRPDYLYSGSRYFGVTASKAGRVIMLGARITYVRITGPTGQALHRRTLGGWAILVHVIPF